MTSLYLVRHGQASLGANNYDELSTAGREQATLLGQHFHALNMRFEQVVSGTLVRQIDTAQSILSAYHASNAHAPALRRDPRFNEYDFEPILKTYAFINGIAEMPLKDPRQFYRFLQGALNAWVGGALASPAIPDWHVFSQRCQAGLAALASSVSNDSRALVVTSGGVIASLVANALGADPLKFVELNLTIRNAAITRLEKTERGWSLVTFNALPHLETAARRHLITMA